MMTVDFQKTLGTFTLSATFAATSGRMTALFGRSGAGKTTLIDCLAGLTRPDTGEIINHGRVFYDAQKAINLAVQDRRVGYVFQEPRLFPHLSVKANLMFGAGRKQRSVEAQIGVEELLDLLGLHPLLTRLPHSLSGGERQRVALGRALLSDPEILLLDEPVSALDQARSGEILSFLQTLKGRLNIPMILVTHRVEDLLRVADDLVLIDNGKVIAAGPLADVASEAGFQSILGDDGAGSVFAMTVRNHRRTDHLSTLGFASGDLFVPLIEAAVGEHVHVRIKATDVAIAKDRPANISMLNILPAEVVEILGWQSGQINLRLRLPGGDVLWARITAKSASDLKIAVGSYVYALIKAVALADPGILR